jgi:hypothetical protein
LISDRADYVKADAAGKVANEVSKPAAAEISTLWNTLKEISNDE